MTETKTFDALSIGTLTTGTALVAGLGRAQEAAEWILGRQVWTHELLGAAKEATAVILAAYPGFPHGPPEDWQALGEELPRRYPDGLAFERGNTVRTMSPVETLRMLVDDSGKVLEVEI